MKGATQFGKTIMELLEKNKLQQKDLADEFGVSLGTISNYINGKTIPEMDFIAKCVKKFGLKKKNWSILFYSLSGVPHVHIGKLL